MPFLQLTISHKRRATCRGRWGILKDGADLERELLLWVFDVALVDPSFCQIGTLSESQRGQRTMPSGQRRTTMNSRQFSKSLKNWMASCNVFGDVHEPKIDYTDLQSVKYIITPFKEAPQNPGAVRITAKILSA